MARLRISYCYLFIKANARKEKLLDSYDLQRFLSDYRDLSSWIASMMGLVSSDELASDVTGAEALLERHQVSFLFFSSSLSKALVFFHHTCHSDFLHFTLLLYIPLKNANQCL